MSTDTENKRYDLRFKKDHYSVWDTKLEAESIACKSRDDALFLMSLLNYDHTTPPGSGKFDSAVLPIPARESDKPPTSLDDLGPDDEDVDSDLLF